MAENLSFLKLLSLFQEEEVNGPQSENRYDQEIDFANKSLQEWKGSIVPI